MAMPIALAIGVLAGSDGTEPFLTQSDVFIRGQDHVNIYRIPGVIVSHRGTVLAFCEAREGGDQSPTDLVLKRSFDGGASWQPMQMVVDGRGTEAIMNPCPVIDECDGTVLLLCNLFPDAKSQYKPGAVKQLIVRSTDDGATWSKPVDVSAQIGDPKTWASLCSGPGVAIQTTTGRLVVPLWHYEGGGRKAYVDGVIYSDDRGATWQHGQNVAGHGSEPQVVERTDGSLLLNIRASKECRRHHRRKICISNDGGRTWGTPYLDDALITPCCQASLLRYTRRSDGYRRDRILFSNPASAKARVNLTVRLSYDEGKTWPVDKTVCAGPSAYSCLTVLPDGTIGVLYETGAKSCYEKICFARFNLAWLSDGKDRLAPRSVGLAVLRRRALGAMREGLGEGKEWVKVHAAEALVWTGYPQRVKQTFLDELAKKPGPKYRIGVWRVLAQAAGDDASERKRYVDLIVAALKDPEGPDRAHAVETLGKLGYGERLDEVVRLANDERQDEGGIRPMARWILANGGAAPDEQRLAALLDSQNVTVRTLVGYACRWLKRIGPETRSRLMTALGDEPVGSRARVFFYSALFVHATAAQRALLQTGLLEYVRRGNVEQKCEACHALALGGDVTHIGMLEGLLSDAELDVRVNAGYAILKILRRSLKADE